jgi:hypothetical protein
MSSGPQFPQVRTRRSKAWVYYTIITVLIVIGAISAGKPVGLLGALVTGLYAVYLYRGGRFVLWLW